MNTPTVSCIIPIYMSGKHNVSQLQRAVASALRQTLTDIEVLVIDDCSPEPVRLDTHDDRLKIYRRPARGGAAAARNTGIAQARGRFVAFLDADDEWFPQKLGRQLEFLHEAGLRLAVCGFEYHRSDSGESTIRFPEQIESAKQLLFRCDACAGSALICDVAVFSEVGPFCEDYHRFEDWDWLLRSVGKGFVTGVNRQVLVKVHYQGWPTPAVISRDIFRLYRRHAWELAGHPPSLLKFTSAILWEIGAAHLHGGRRMTSLVYGLSALMIWPFRSFSFLANGVRRFRQPRIGKSDRPNELT